MAELKIINKVTLHKNVRRQHWTENKQKTQQLKQNMFL